MQRVSESASHWWTNDRIPLSSNLEQISSSNCITIKPAGKGGTIVILNNEDYTIMFNKILKKQEWYKRITPEIIEKYYREFYSLVNSAYSN